MLILRFNLHFLLSRNYFPYVPGVRDLQLMPGLWLSINIGPYAKKERREK